MREKTVVSVLPYNANGEVLLQLRDDKPGLAYANHWTLFGGQMEDGETPDEAMRREVREELDIELPLVYWQTFECPVRTRSGELHVLNRVYVAEMRCDIATLTLYEGQRMAYFGAVEAAGMRLAFEQQNILNAFFAEREANGLR